VLAGLAAVTGVGYAAVSAYWASGGQGLLTTLGRPFESWGHSRNLTAAVALWTVVAIKLVAAGLPAVTLSWAPRRVSSRTVRRLAWAAAGILLVYGLIVSAGDWLSQAGVLGQAGAKDHRALAWHAFLWDPWFLLWGALATGALVCERRSRPGPMLDDRPWLDGGRPADD